MNEELIVKELIGHKEIKIKNEIRYEVLENRQGSYENKLIIAQH
jgi:hypothetical protein